MDFDCFWGHTRPDPNVLDNTIYSQFDVCPIPLGLTTIEVPTAEHLMMLAKARLFDDKKTYIKILNAKSPLEAKKLGRQVNNFDVAFWQEYCFQIVVLNNHYKFSINPNYGEYLVKSGDSIIVECSPYDTIWGIGLGMDNPDRTNPAKWRGNNLLGFALMLVRKKLKEGRVINRDQYLDGLAEIMVGARQKCG